MAVFQWRYRKGVAPAVEDVLDAVAAGRSLEAGSGAKFKSGSSESPSGSRVASAASKLKAVAAMASTPRSAGGRKRASKKVGKRPATEVSPALKEKLSTSADGNAESGIRVQLARSISMVFAPSGYKAPAEAGSVPEDSLELEYVHGYGGKNMRANLFLNEAGRVVYPMAALGVVCDPESRDQRHRLQKQ